MMKKTHVKNLAEFVAAVRALEKQWKIRNRTTPLWFRGHADASWSLLPGLYRGRVDAQFERELVRDFDLYSAPFLTGMGTTTAFDRLFVMQHYGMPTRLLDWTESQLVALYFAVLSPESPEDATVFVLDPWRLNKVSLGQQSVPTIDHPSVSDYLLRRDPEGSGRLVPGKDPIALRPPHHTERIRAQNGFFTVHGHSQEPLDSFRFDGLSKIVIRSAAKGRMLREVIKAGVSPKVVFPDLSGLCQDISLRYAMQEHTRRRVVSVRGTLGAGKSTPRKVASKRVTSTGRPIRFSERPELFSGRVGSAGRIKGR